MRSGLRLGEAGDGAEVEIEGGGEAVNLNEEQETAVNLVDGPVLVLAGAGSGKTSVISEKIAHLLRLGLTPPEMIFAITFTKKAAAEMRERLSARVGAKAARKLNVSTFHSLGARILREEAQALGLKPDFSIMSETERRDLMADSAGRCGPEAAALALSKASEWKNALVPPNRAMALCRGEEERMAAAVYRKYEERLHAYHAVDFDDLIRLPCELFESRPDVGLKWARRVGYLMLDESQDTNAAQFALMRHLVKEARGFTAVGDDDQSIYSWRGADGDNLRRLRDDYPTLRVVKLERNYRSTNTILRCANALIGHNEKRADYVKKLWNSAGEGEPVTLMPCADESAEANRVAEIIQSLVAKGTWRYRHFAVLYRGNHQSRPFEDVFRGSLIPYRVAGGNGFFDKPEARDCLAYARVLINPNDYPAFLRASTAPKRGIGAETLRRVNAYCLDNAAGVDEAMGDAALLSALSPAPRRSLEAWRAMIRRYSDLARAGQGALALREFLREGEYERHCRDNCDKAKAERKTAVVGEFLRWVELKEAEGKSLKNIVDNLALMDMLGESDDESDAVRLSTIHSSKGLEFPVVFVAGCEEGVFPNEDNCENGDVSEERRLMYVALTRAKKLLFLSYCKRRRRPGVNAEVAPSRFLSELPEKDVAVDSGFVMDKQAFEALRADFMRRRRR